MQKVLGFSFWSLHSRVFGNKGYTIKFLFDIYRFNLNGTHRLPTTLKLDFKKSLPQQRLSVFRQVLNAEAISLAFFLNAVEIADDFNSFFQILQASKKASLFLTVLTAKNSFLKKLWFFYLRPIEFESEEVVVHCKLVQ